MMSCQVRKPRRDETYHILLDDAQLGLTELVAVDEDVALVIDVMALRVACAIVKQRLQSARATHCPRGLARPASG